jgi:hypothetical protein
MASSDPVETRLVVAIRPRPLAADEAADAQLCFGGELHTITLAPSASGGPATALPFDRVFDAHAGNGDVYAAVAQPIVQAALRGINGAVAAYGQTGSGKTRTMRGTPDDAGVVQRAVRDSRARRGQRAPRGLTRPRDSVGRLARCTRTWPPRLAGSLAWVCSISKYTTKR